MAVKFSQFTEEAGAANVTRLVGFTATGNLNIQIPPANIDTLVTSNTAQSGTSATYTLSGTKTGTATTTDLTTYTVPANSGMALTAGTNTIAFDATSYKLTSTNTSPAGTVPLVLTGTGGGDAGTDTVNLVGSGTIGITSSGNTITINGSSAAGSVTSFNQVVGALSTGTALTAGGTGAGPFTGAVTIASNIYNGTTNVGIVPTGGSNTTFLRGDGQWITPAGGGGTVTNVSSASNASALTLVTTSQASTPIATLGVTGGSAGQFLNYLGNWATPAGGGSGTVTSVGLTETGTALTITSDTANPIVGTGTFNIAGAGTSSQVILGDLSLATLPTDTNTTYTVDVPAGTTSINLKGSDATDDPIVLVGGTDIGLVRDSANQITINSQAVGGVTNVTSADTNTITVASGASTPAITAVTSGGVGAGSTSLATGAQIQTAIDTALSSALIFKGGYDASTNAPVLDSRGTPIAISVGDTYIVSVAGTFYGDAVTTGETLIAKVDRAAGASSAADWTVIQENIGLATATTAGISSYPTTGGLTVDGNGAVSIENTYTAGSYTNSSITVDSDGYVSAISSGAASLPTKTVDTVASIPNATTGTFALGVTPSSENYVDLYISGVYQSKTSYTVAGSTLTLDGSLYFPQGALVETVTTT